MNHQKMIRKPSDLANVPLGGIEVIQTLSGSGGSDFASITLRDTQTNTLLTVSRSQYSDCNLHATTKPKTEKRYVVVIEGSNGTFRSKPLATQTEVDAEKARADDAAKVTVEIIQVEVHDE